MRDTGSDVHVHVYRGYSIAVRREKQCPVPRMHFRSVIASLHGIRHDKTCFVEIFLQVQINEKGIVCVKARIFYAQINALMVLDQVALARTK